MKKEEKEKINLPGYNCIRTHGGVVVVRKGCLSWRKALFMMLVTWGKSSRFSGLSFPSYKWDNNSFGFGKVREFISPGESCSHRRNWRRRGEWGRCGNSRELRGAYGLHGERAAAWRGGGAWEPAAAGFEIEGFTKKAPFSQEKGLLRDRACTGTGRLCA